VVDVLVAARLALDRVDEAREHLDQALATPWRSGDLFDVQSALEQAERP